ncbi:MAG: YfhO family protein, partial [Oscillospiraceae bacterium]
MQKAFYKRYPVAITAAIAAAMLLLRYVLLGIYPFGDGTLLTGDLNGQYINYFAHFKSAFSGQGGFAYSFTKSLGGNLLGLFAYYVSSPLNLLYLLVPVNKFAGMVSVVFFIKIMLACSSFCFYIYRKFPQMSWLGIPLSLGYGFMAYTLVYAQNIMWHDVVILLPLACYGVDRIVQGKPATFYTVVLALAICLAMAIFVLLWGKEPEMRPLGVYYNQELIETLDYLDAQKVEYKIDGNSVLVRADQYADIQLGLR